MHSQEPEAKFERVELNLPPDIVKILDDNNVVFSAEKADLGRPEFLFKGYEISIESPHHPSAICLRGHYPDNGVAYDFRNALREAHSVLSRPPALYRIVMVFGGNYPEALKFLDQLLKFIQERSHGTD